SRLRRLAELASLLVADDAAEVLRLADDRRVGHARELVAHLDGDRVERAGDHPGGDRVDPCGAGYAHCVSTRMPSGSARASQQGGSTIVVSRWKTTAGPGTGVSWGRRERS